MTDSSIEKQAHLAHQLRGSPATPGNNDGMFAGKATKPVNTGVNDEVCEDTNAEPDDNSVEDDDM